MRRGILRAFALVFLFSFLSNLQLWAQGADAKQAPAAEGVTKFTSKSQLVMVPVVVTGKNGEHVGGLGREAFRIEEQGKVREATIFEEVKPIAPYASPGPVPKLEGRSNFDFEDAPRGHMTVVVLDLLNTPYLGQGDGVKRLVEYLSKTLPRNEAAAVFGLGAHGLRQLYPPTTDTAALLKALKGVPRAASGATNGATSEDPAMQTARNFSEFVGSEGTVRGEYNYLQASWTTLEAMTQIADAYTAIPGRKTLIWASAGFPYLNTSTGMTRTTLVNKYEKTWRDLVSADIAVYSIDVSDLAGFKGSLLSYRGTARKELVLREFAEETGGIPCIGIAIDIEKCFARAVEDSSSYYLLGYYLPANDQKAGWRKLKVKVNVPGVHVRARQGFYVSGATEETAQTRERKLMDALRSPIEFTGVRMNVRELKESKPAAAGMINRGFEVGVLGDSITVDAEKGNAVDLSVVAMAVNAQQKGVWRVDSHLDYKLKPELLEKFRKTGLSTVQWLELAPGKYEIRFAAQDNLSGEIGTVVYPIEVK